MKKLILLAVLLLVSAAPLSSSISNFGGPTPYCDPNQPDCVPPPPLAQS